ISLIRSAARKTHKLTNKQLKLAIQSRLMENKKQYSAKAVSMATQICGIGEMSYRSAIACTKKVIEWLIDEEPDKWFSVSTLVGWHQDISDIHLIQQCSIVENSKWFTFGIMADESTRGDNKVFVICFMYWDLITNEPKVTLLELEDLAQCSGISVARTVIDS
ncbi:13825_t:CDS:1, partial [Racocetra persica]